MEKNFAAQDKPVRNEVNINKMNASFDGSTLSRIERANSLQNKRNITISNKQIG